MSYILDNAFNDYNYLTKIAKKSQEELDNESVAINSQIGGMLGGAVPAIAGQAAILGTMDTDLIKSMTHPDLTASTPVDERGLVNARRLARRLGWKSTKGTMPVDEYYPATRTYNGKKYVSDLEHPVNKGNKGIDPRVTKNPMNSDILVDPVNGRKLNISPTAIDGLPGPHMLPDGFSREDVLMKDKLNYGELYKHVKNNRGNMGILGAVEDYIAPKGAQTGHRTVRLPAGGKYLGVAAHELGHSKQDFNLWKSQAYALGTKAPAIGAVGNFLGNVATSYGVSDDTVDKIQLGSGVLGTLAGAPMLATEIDASYRGYKAIPKTSHPNSRRLKMTAFSGVPSYAGIVLTPLAQAGASIIARHKRRAELEEKHKQSK